MNKLEEIKKSTFSIGSRIELVLYEGAEYDSGIKPSGMGPKGYSGGVDMTKNPGMKFTGYIASYDKDRIFLAQGWNKDRYANGSIYFHKEVIHSYYQ